jgi:hypothetical protein
MKKLEDFPIGQRIAITVIIVLAVLFALALYGYLTGGWEAEAQQFQPAVLSKHEKQFIEMDRMAATAAYKEQIHHLFLTWAKDERDQPKRAVTGALQARSMYERAMMAIDAREKRFQDEGGIK